jgi:hypothetical protein
MDQTITLGAPGSRLRRTVARVHAAFLVVITIALVAIASAGWQGSGLYSVLADQPLGYVGLYQAYLLMFLIAVISWIGAGRWGGRMWNVLLMCAELVPLSIIFIAGDVLDAAGQQPLAPMIGHSVLASIEAFALLWNPSGARSEPTRA